MDITEEAINRFYVELGARIRNARMATKMSQQELAESVGLKRSSIANIEAGRQRSVVHLIALIGQSLELSPDELFPSVRESEKMSEMEDFAISEIKDQPEDTQDFVTATLRRATGG